MSHVGGARVVLSRVEEEPNSVDKFDPVEGANAEVEKDPEDDGHWN